MQSAARPYDITRHGATAADSQHIYSWQHSQIAEARTCTLATQTVPNDAQSRAERSKQGAGQLVVAHVGVEGQAARWPTPPATSCCAPVPGSPPLWTYLAGDAEVPSDGTCRRSNTHVSGWCLWLVTSIQISP
jgi:hypothetical protein